MQLNRLFFALWPGDAVRSACCETARQLQLRLPSGGHASQPQRYHLTLLFLGDEVPAAQEAAALRAAATVRSPPFTLSLDQAGSFGARDMTWWLGARQPPAELGMLVERLREALQRANAPARRMRFTPHLTVARKAQRALPPTPVAAIDWPLDEFVLIRSHLDRRPIEYEIIGRWPLQPSAEPDPPSIRSQLDLGF